jgi:hypothetical protein
MKQPLTRHGQVISRKGKLCAEDPSSYDGPKRRQAATFQTSIDPSEIFDAIES